MKKSQQTKLLLTSYQSITPLVQKNKTLFITTHYVIALLVILVSSLFNQSVAEENVMTVYKSPTCGCCKKWISHMEDNGFKVETVNTSNVVSVKQANNIPAKTWSCHSAKINGYVIEGHVPATDIKKLLAEKRDVAGLAVPGMPMGSPGMEGYRKDHYSVYEFDKQGLITTVNQY